MGNHSKLQEGDIFENSKIYRNEEENHYKENNYTSFICCIICYILWMLQ